MLQVPINPTHPNFPPPADPISNPTLWQQIDIALSQSAHQVLVRLASFLPGVLALLLAVVVLAGLGALLSYVLRRVLTNLRFDERMNRNTAATLSDFSPSRSPTLLLARTTFWACVLLGFVIGISAFDASYPNSSQMSAFFLPYLTHSVGAILLLFAGNILARFLARSVLIGAVNAKLQYARFLSLGIKWLVLVLAAAMALDHLGVGGTIIALAFGILFGGIVLTLALAVGLGSRDIVTRSLERNAEFLPQADPMADATRASRPGTETLRHF